MENTEPQEGRWSEPLDLRELGELNARWLEGAGWAPWHGGGPIDDETVPLAAGLAGANRRGYVTDFSQPGEDHGGRAQRAAVGGYCEAGQAACLASLSLEGELVVITHYPGVDSTYEIPITRVEGRTSTVEAGHLGSDLGHLWPGIHPRTAQLLSEHYHVALFDPQWGRDDVLWASVARALARDPEDCKGALFDPTAH